MKNLFIVVLQYIVNLETIDVHREEHIKFLDVNYKNGIFIASGPQVPRTGGIIIAKSEGRLSLEKILHNDPFAIHDLAKYQIFEFSPTKYNGELKVMLEK